MRTRVGYAGGTKKNPTYHDLGDHTETTEIDFDPQVITFEQVLDLFWSIPDSCSVSWSRQYDKILFYHDDEQKKLALASKEAVEKKLGKKIETKVLPYTGFTLAEGYHQKYSLRNNDALMTLFRKAYPSDADFVASTAAARVNAFLAGDLSRDEAIAELTRIASADNNNAQILAIREGIQKK